METANTNLNSLLDGYPLPGLESHLKQIPHLNPKPQIGETGY